MFSYISSIFFFNKILSFCSCCLCSKARVRSCLKWLISSSLCICCCWMIDSSLSTGSDLVFLKEIQSRYLFHIKCSFGCCLFCLTSICGYLAFIWQHHHHMVRYGWGVTFPLLLYNTNKKIHFWGQVFLYLCVYFKSICKIMLIFKHMKNYMWHLLLICKKRIFRSFWCYNSALRQIQFIFWCLFLLLSLLVFVGFFLLLA